MIKLTSYSFILIALVYLSSCGSSPEETPVEKTTISKEKVIGTSVDEIIKRGKLIAITNNSPTSYFIYRGRPMGYQYDILSDFADYLGVELEVKIVPSISDAIDSVNTLHADILASGITVLGDRKSKLDFSVPITQTRQVLIQKKPDGYEKMHPNTLERNLLRDVTQLAGKTVFVEEGSAYLDRIKNLQNEIGDSIHIVTYNGEIDLDSLMYLVSSEQITYAIGEEYTSKFFLRYYDDIDIETPISFNQNIAWATPLNSPTLIDTINQWINANKGTTHWAIVYNKYFKYNKKMNTRVMSKYTMNNGVISPYDKIIKENAEKIGWDWMLVAAQIGVESGFKPGNKSWVGASGLMQLMPATADELHPGPGGGNLNNPAHNIALGTKYNKRLYDYWTESIPDSLQAIKFTLASYNIGKGHVLDAQRLAKKYDYDPLIWDDNVDIMIRKLSKSSYYRDDVVYYGYCRGLEAYNYVNRIFDLYYNYQNFESKVN